MGTPAVVGIKNNETFTVIRVHYDGYLSCMGDLLLNHYDENKLRSALGLGNASSLGASLDSLPMNCKDFSLYSRFLVRDDNENAQYNKAITLSSTIQLFTEFKNVKNFYILDSGIWYHSYSDRKFSEITLEYIRGDD